MCTSDSGPGVGGASLKLLLLTRLLLRDGVLQGDGVDETTSSKAFRRQLDSPSEGPSTARMWMREGSSQGSRLKRIGDCCCVIV